MPGARIARRGTPEAPFGAGRDADTEREYALRVLCAYRHFGDFGQDRADPPSAPITARR
jgi:hypothetical protein